MLLRRIIVLGGFLYLAGGAPSLAPGASFELFGIDFEPRLRLGVSDRSHFYFEGESRGDVLQCEQDPKENPQTQCEDFFSETQPVFSLSFFPVQDGRPDFLFGNHRVGYDFVIFFNDRDNKWLLDFPRQGETTNVDIVTYSFSPVIFWIFGDPSLKDENWKVKLGSGLGIIFGRYRLTSGGRNFEKRYIAIALPIFVEFEFNLESLVDKENGSFTFFIEQAGPFTETKFSGLQDDRGEEASLSFLVQDLGFRFNYIF